ncbi:DUF5110 domain-containing protein [Sphingomonas sp. 22176]|uniref:DUF5110 domain-containing protein n=1 Tax=Sphingomonas sp. 22176 TaxID=3453884 RepID=UPI003F84B728
MTDQPRRVSAGGDWYDYWTNHRYTGGQTVTAAAPIDKIPLFVRAGSIVPIGVQVPSTATKQALESIHIYPGRDTSFTLYDDDGVSNRYQHGGGTAVTLQWNETTRRLVAAGPLPTGQDVAKLVHVVQPDKP